MDADTMLQIGNDAFISSEPEKAFAYYLSAAKKGNTEAQYRTGVCFENGLGVFNNREKAIYWYKKSAESNDSVSKYYLATVYHWMLSEEQRDYNKAFALYHEAFNEGVAEAADNIENMYSTGQGVEQNDQIAVEWYEKGAAAGSLWAMFDMYKVYMNGKGIEKDEEKAKEWLAKCKGFFNVSLGKCDKLLTVGCTNLIPEIAYEYFCGNKIFSASVDQAMIWAEKGALIGNLKSLDLLAQLCFESGNCSEAIKHLYRAADYGFSWSMNSLGMKYHDDNDESLATDKVLANEMFSRGAKFGNSLSQLNIAYGFCTALWVCRKT